MKTQVNVPIMLASLLFASLLWFYVYQETTPNKERSFRVRLNQSNLDSSKYIVTTAPQYIYLKAQGPVSRVSKLHEEDLEADVDLHDARPERAMYPVQIFPERERDLFSSSINARIEVEPFAKRSVQLGWDSRGEISDKTLKLDDMIVEPKSITVTGPKSQVDRVAEVRAVLDLTKVNPSVRKAEQVGVEILDDGGRPLPNVKSDPLFANLTPVFNPAPEERVAFVLPTTTGQPASGHVITDYRLEPNHVLISGKSAVLARLSQIKTVALDVEGISRTGTYTVSLVLPEGVTSVTPKQVRMTVVVRKLIAAPTEPETTPAKSKNP